MTNRNEHPLIHSPTAGPPSSDTTPPTAAPAAPSATQPHLLTRCARLAGFTELAHGISHLHTATISALILVLVLLYYAYSFKHVIGVFAALGDPGLVTDYVLFYYPQGQQILVDPRPVTGFVYPLVFALCMVPLSQLTLYAAIWTWMAVQLVITTGLFVLPAVHLLRASRPVYFVYLLTFLLSVPILDCMRWGQPSSLIVLSLLGCLYLYRNHHDRSAALLLALATSTKFYPGLFVVYFLLRRDYRFVAYWAGFVGLFLIAIPILLTSPRWWVDYHYWLYDHMNTLRIATRNMAGAQYFPYVVFRHYGGLIHVDSQVAVLRRVSLAVVAVNLLIVNRLARRSRQEGTIWSFLLLFGCMPFVVESSWPHYFCWLPFCQALLALSFVHRRIGAADAAMILLLLVPSILTSSMFYLHLPGGWQFMHRHGLMLLSNTLMMILTWLRMPSIRYDDHHNANEPQ